MESTYSDRNLQILFLNMKIDLKDAWIIIQGSSFYDENNFAIGGTPYSDLNRIIDFYSNYNNVIWSTWEDTPIDIVECLKLKNINTIINKYPSNRGRGNCNLQKISTLNGIQVAKYFNAKYVFKIRTDLIFPKIEEVIERIKLRLDSQKRLSGLCWDNWQESKFILDQLLFGYIEDVELFWSLDNINGFVERQTIKEYLNKRNILYHPEGVHEMGGGDHGFKFIKEYFDFFMQDLLDLNIDLVSYKKYKPQPNGKNYTKHYSHQELYKTEEYPWFRKDWCQVVQFNESLENRWMWK